jgi:hypothetical protein
MLSPTQHRLRRHMTSRHHLGTRLPRWAQVLTHSEPSGNGLKVVGTAQLRLLQ